jgi:glycine betaine/proline transport system permease protein
VTVAYALAGTRIAVLAGATLLACGYLGYWEDSLDLLIVTGVAVGICVLIGLPLGIWMARSKRATAVISPVLDVMQTMPSFAYLAPLVLFFGIGAASAVVTTVIYSLPPLVRISAHGLRSVAPATVEASTSLGSTSGQLLRSVQLPMARRTILVGLNQTTMAALSMATIAALINGPGLGQPVIEALQINDVGSAAVSGLCIVLLAIMLDRATTAAGERAELAQRSGQNAQVRRIVLATLAVVTVLAIYLSRQYTRFATFPESELGPWTANLVSDVTDAVVDAIRPITQAVKDFVTYGFLNPLQSLLTESPWWLMAGVLLAFAYLLGGVRALASTLVCVAVILGTGLWNESMVTLASTLVATVLVMVLGIAVGVWMGRSRRVDTSIRPVLDALQTIPPFVYLIPALALFGPGRFTAIVAAVAYAAPVATKLVADGIRGVSATSVEAAESAGTSTGQMIRKVQLPMARGAVILALNQGLLFVLSMVVIGGLVGGGGLGFLVVTGFAQSEDFGKGLAAGIAITALGVMLDRISVYTAARYGRSATP